MNLQYEILDHTEVLPRVSQKISTSEAIDYYAATMCFNPSDVQVANLYNTLMSHLDQGDNSLCFAVDAYTVLEPRALGPFVMPLLMRSQDDSDNRQQAMDQLKSVGGNVALVNNLQIGGNLFAGRMHAKAHVLGDGVIIGGPNMDGTDRFDLGVSFRSKHAAYYMRSIISSLIEAGTTEVLGAHDMTLSLDSNTDLLIDVGRPRQSLIHETAIDMIDSAEDFIVFCSQYAPIGVELRHLEKAAERGVQTYIVGNDPVQHAHFPRLVKLIERLNYGSQKSDIELLRGSIDLPKIHTKALATEQTWMIGSHNLTSVGVRLGTMEASVVQHDVVMAHEVARTALSHAGLSLNAIDARVPPLSTATMPI